MKLYILNLNGAESGPFTEQQLQALWLTGGVTVTTDWRLAPQGDWRNGSELPELLEYKKGPSRSKVSLLALWVAALVITVAALIWMRPVRWEYDEETEAMNQSVYSVLDRSTVFKPDASFDARGWEYCGSYMRVVTTHLSGGTDTPAVAENVFVFRRRALW